MTRADDADPIDRYLDQRLAEQLGGERPAMQAERVLCADAEERALAAARVDAAAAALAGEDAAVAPRPPVALWRIVALAAAALAVVGLATTWWSRPEAPADPEAHALVMIDAFHRVMPTAPAVLRDPVRRAQFAAAAIPVVREVGDCFAALPARVAMAARAPEFPLWAAVLGDAEASSRFARLGGDPALLAATVAAITADGAAVRSVAIERLAELLRTPPPGASSAVHCLVTAGDLSVAEAQRLAKAAGDEVLANRFWRAAEVAASDPRRLLGAPFELAGRLHTGAEFSTAALRGKVVLVVFWASWCAPCASLMPQIVDVAQRHAGRGLAVVGVSCDQDPAALQRFLAEHPQVDWPQLFDAGRPGWHELAFQSGVRLVPRLFLLDRRGVLRDVDARDGLEQLVLRLLAE